MKNMNSMIRSAITAVLALAAVSSSITTTQAATNPEMEKCYGIAKSGLNDCQTSTASCAGSAKKDAQSDAFLFVPKGTCNKIVMGSLIPKTEKIK